MRFNLEQRFANPVEEVRAAFVDPALLTELATLPELGRPQLLELVDDGASVSQQVRFPLVGPKVERAIVSGLHDHACAEARIVQAWLDRR